jgi:hypothetical protein
MKKLLRLAALTVMAFSLTTGVAAASVGSIDTTGPDSTNIIRFRNRSSVRVSNDNNVGVGNVNLQFADSGDAKVKHNTTGGDATSGDAANDNLTRTRVAIDNSGSSGDALANACGCDGSEASIENTGPDSYNRVSVNNDSSVRVRNDNNVGVLNFSVQSADSGDARVEDNTTGGDATSGDATNVNTTETTVEITN